MPTSSARDFGELVRSEAEFVWRMLRRFGLSATDAEDAAQTVFLVASRKLHEVAPGKERSFLYSTAVRVAANARRGLRRRPEIPADLDDVVADQPLPDDLLAQQRARELLDSLLSELPPELHRVLVLAEVEQLSVSAIAELEQIPGGTAASRLRRARSEFQKLLSRHHETRSRRQP